MSLINCVNSLKTQMERLCIMSLAHLSLFTLKFEQNFDVFWIWPLFLIEDSTTHINLHHAT